MVQEPLDARQLPASGKRGVFVGRGSRVGVENTDGYGTVDSLGNTELAHRVTDQAFQSRSHHTLAGLMSERLTYRVSLAYI